MALWIALALVALTGTALPPAPPRVDYADPAHWICRPGVDDGTCSAGLDAAAVAAYGTRTPLARAPVGDPPIDCFYVYPTASLDPTPLGDLHPDAEKRYVHDQAARLGARCRLFAPIYHQVTIAALMASMKRAGGDAGAATDIAIPCRDVLAAWRHYLHHDNQGRGVVLIGHSQGARILTRLIAEEIEGRPAQEKLVAAYLVGNQQLDSLTFRVIRPCRTAGQTGCLVAWSSYPAGYSGPRVFGAARARATPVCVNPAALAGEPAMTVIKPALALPGDPPYAMVVDGVDLECVADTEGAVLQATITAGPNAAMLRAALTPSRADPAWGLHGQDIALVQGNMVDLIATQGAAWAHR